MLALITHKQYCHVGRNAMDCGWELFRVADFAGHLSGSKSTSGGVLCAESDITSLDTGLRMERTSARN